jgi:vacuolar protein sorting-associated protein 45
MNIAQPIRGYIDKMTSEVTGLKVLLLDDETSGMVSMVYTQSEIIAKEVYLIEGIGKFDDRQEMPHLKCLTYLRPTEENISLLCRELRKPNYGEYHLFFTNIIPRDFLQRLAESDEREVVKRCEEYFGDVFVVNTDAYTVRTAPTAIGERVTQGLLSSLLALKRKPTAVRYQKNSGSCQSIANAVSKVMQVESELFHFTHGSCTLLIVDRWEDAVTPLLSPWTYQAMLHEYLTIDRNRVVVDKSENMRQKIEAGEKKIEDNEFIFSPSQDSFFQRHMYVNWGELCTAIKDLVDTFQATCNLKELKSTGSLADLKALMQQLPETRKLGSTVSKHVTTVGEIGDQLRKRGLFNIGQLEQDIACNSNHSDHWRQLVDLINNFGAKQAGIQAEDVLRVSMLYFLRYEKNQNCNFGRLKDLLSSNGVPAALLERLTALRDRCGADKRQSTSLLFPSENNIFKIVMGAVKGMDSETSVYTQHEPLLKKLITATSKGALPGDLYPSTEKSVNVNDKVREVIVFVVGGATYAEAAAVYQMNNPEASKGGPPPPDVKVVLGTTEMINIEQFMKML